MSAFGTQGKATDCLKLINDNWKEFVAHFKCQNDILKTFILLTALDSSYRESHQLFWIELFSQLDNNYIIRTIKRFRPDLCHLYTFDSSCNTTFDTCHNPMEELKRRHNDRDSE